MSRRGPLHGLKVLEVEGIGPGPFCGMMLADMGADVVLVERPHAATDAIDTNGAPIINRGKDAIGLDLKSVDGHAAMMRLVRGCDVLVEGMRPGVMERLGLGPDTCLRANPRLVYGRLTGWGQEGPLAQAAGHDINYIALSGALWYSGNPGDAPMAPPSLIGDIGGGALYLTIGILAAVMHARATGTGQVVDAAIVDGTAHMMNLLLSLKGLGHFVDERGKSILDGPHWYSTYKCADGKFISVGPLESKFYYLLIDKLGMDQKEFAGPHDSSNWERLKARLAARFASRTSYEWCTLLEGSDVCFAPVLNPEQAAVHPHIASRGTYKEVDGVLQAMPAPRFSLTNIGMPKKGSKTITDFDAVIAKWTAERDM